MVGRNPKLEVTVGVEGAGDPTLLHFFVEDGMVQVNADSSVATRVTEATPASPRHADFDAEVEQQAEEPYVVPAAYAPSAAYATERETGEATRWIGYDDRDRYDPGMGYGVSGYAEPEAYTDHYDRPYDGQRRYDEPRTNGASPGTPTAVGRCISPWPLSGTRSGPNGELDASRPPRPAACALRRALSAKPAPIGRVCGLAI